MDSIIACALRGRLPQWTADCVPEAHTDRPPKQLVSQIETVSAAVAYDKDHG